MSQISQPMVWSYWHILLKRIIYIPLFQSYVLSLQLIAHIYFHNHLVDEFASPLIFSNNNHLLLFALTGNQTLHL